MNLAIFLSAILLFDCNGKTQSNSKNDLFTEEWELFIFARNAWNYNVSSSDISQYSENLKERIESTINTFYPELNCTSLDIFLDTYTYRSRKGYSLNDAVIGIDYRIKYAIFSYSYVEALIAFVTDTDETTHRSARATAFELNEDDLKKLLGNNYPIPQISDTMNNEQ